MKKISLALGALALVFSVAGCSTNSSDSPRPNIVVSTNSYAQLVRDLQGGISGETDPTFDIQVISENSNVDPHDFEPSAKDRLLVANADLVLYIGTEVDQYMQPLVDSVGFPEENTIIANQYRVIACPPGAYCSLIQAEEDKNPHLWYDLDSDIALAPKITASMQRLQPQYSDIYEAALKRFMQRAKGIKVLQNNFRAALPQDQISYFTAPENIANTFMGDLGLTPTRFGSKIENGVELSVKEMESFKRQMKQMKIKLFVANEQVESAQAKELADYAESIGVPVVEFSETRLCETNASIGEAFVDCFYYKMLQVKFALGIEVEGMYFLG